MSLLEPFSKPRWQHPKPEVRLAAIDELDDKAVLLEVLQTDEDVAVRARALSRIDDSELLDRLIDDPAPGQALPAELRQQARAQRLAQLLPDSAVLATIADDGTLLRIAHLADEPGLAEAAIGRIQDPGLLMELAGGHPQAKARLCAAQSIADITLLQALMQQAKHKDKAVFRHCRERVDEHLAVQRAEEQRRNKLEQLAQDAAALRAAVDSPEYRGRYGSLEHRWAALREHATPAQQELIQGDLDVCARRLEQLAAARTAEEQERAQVAEAAGTFVVLLAELDAIDPAALAAAPADLDAQLNHIEERWVAALRLAHPAPAQTEACKGKLIYWRGLLRTLQQLASRKTELGRFFKEVGQLDPADFKAVQKVQQHAAKLTRALPWPEELASALPDVIGQLREQRDLLDQRIATLQKKEEKTLAKATTALEAFRAELATNHYRNADRALNKLRNLLRQLSPARQDHFQNELRPLLTKLQEIHDWQGFAIEPKKVELVEHMKALVGSSDDADTLAAKIKALQDEWKQLGPLAPRRDQELWRAFRAAADEAWAPCKEAFDQRAEARKEVYRQRMALVAQLIEYEKKIAWPDLESPDPELPAPDWKMVRKTLNTARKAFTELSPVERKQERKSQKALDKVCNRIYAHLEKEYARNIERKQALVAEAQTLVAMEDLKQAIDRAKSIQREWKDIGLTPQRLDRPLWKDFRKTCDAIFARLGEERNQRNAEAKARAEQRQANERARAEQAAQKKQQKQERWQKLLDRMQACALKPEDPDKAAALWDEAGKLPNDIDAEALEAWWQSGPGDSDTDALREACIALEVLAGIESPPEEKQARMAYQMKRLVAGMGSGQGDQRERLLETINGFIALRPSAEWVARFSGTVETARAMVR